MSENNSEKNDNFEELASIFGEDETYEVITIVDDDGQERDCFVVDGIEVDKTKYILLVDCEEFDKSEPEAYLFKEVEEDGDEFVYEPVEDDEEYNKIIILLQDEDSGYEMKF